MKNAFINAAGVLTAWGFMESNNGDTAVPVDDDFDLEPGIWRWQNGQWVDYAGQVTAAPRTVSPGQGRIALIRAGKLAAVQAAVDALGEEAKAAFEFATSWDRDSQLLNAIAEPLALDLDALFVEAAAIKL